MKLLGTQLYGVLLWPQYHAIVIIILCRYHQTNLYNKEKLEEKKR